MLREVDMCNLALLKLGSSTITSLEASVIAHDPTAELCNFLYESNRQKVLRDSIWSFSLKEKTIPRAVDAPLFGYQSKFAFPNDYLRLSELYITEDTITYGTRTNLVNVEGSYTIRGNDILINTEENSLDIVYVFDNKVVKSYPAIFVEAMATSLAVALAPSLLSPDKMTLKDTLYKEYSMILANAKAVQGTEQKVIRINTSAFNRARR